MDEERRERILADERMRCYYRPWKRAWYKRHDFSPPHEIIRRWVRAAKRLQEEA